MGSIARRRGEMAEDRHGSIFSGRVWRSAPTLSWRSDGDASQRVLIVDDDVNLTRLVRTILRIAGFDVEAAGEGEEALRLAETGTYDVILLDLRMPGMDGRTVYRELRARGIESPVLIASAYGARSAQLELGAQGSIEKPFDPDRLVEAVTELLAAEPR